VAITKRRAHLLAEAKSRFSSISSPDTPDYPLGVTFAGRAWSEHKLLRLAYAFEQASRMRKPPPGLLGL
jgi:amidase